MTEMRTIVTGVTLSRAVCNGVGRGRERWIRIHGRARPRVAGGGLPGAISDVDLWTMVTPIKKGRGF
jgi:hypothetical protein